MNYSNMTNIYFFQKLRIRRYKHIVTYKGSAVE